MSDDPAFLNIPGHFEQVYVGPKGTVCYGYGYQPTTDDIATHAKGHRFCVQLIGDNYEVYDLQTLKVYFGASTIGLPVFTSKDPDAAIMWALMSQ